MKKVTTSQKYHIGYHSNNGYFMISCGFFYFNELGIHFKKNGSTLEFHFDALLFYFNISLWDSKFPAIKNIFKKLDKK